MSDTTTTTAVSTFELIKIEEFTHNVVKDDTTHTVTGDGVFDILMDTATKHLLAQYEANRIRGENYATAYIQVYIETLRAALRVWIEKGLQEKQAELLDKQIELAEKQLELYQKQLETEDAKKDLYRRQIEGFDEDFKQKLLKIGLDSWAVGFSVAKDTVAPDANMIPAAMTKTALDNLWNQAIVPEVDINTYQESAHNVTHSTMH